MSKKTQLELITEVAALALVNPLAKIKICVDNELADEFGWTAHEIRSVKLTIWIEIDERIYTDEDSARDAIGDMIYDNRKISLNNLDVQIDKYLKDNSITAICIFTSA